MISDQKMTMRELLKRSRTIRIVILLCAGLLAGTGAVYLYFHDPKIYPIPCAVHLLTGLYCPGCGAGRACFALLHGDIVEAFCYNPLMVILIPFLGLYIAARGIDWAITGGNHVDGRISVRFLIAVLVLIMIYGILRNIPVQPFSLLAPGGLRELF